MASLPVAPGPSGRVQHCTPPPVLDCTGLTYRFGRVDALRGVDLTVFPAEIYGLLGRNGAGKTTAIRCSLGLLRARSGRARILGASMDRPPRDVFRHIGVLFEDFAAHGFLSGEEHLSMRAALLGLGSSDARSLTAQWLARVGLAPVARRKVRGYSLGMVRRLGLACALVGSPRLVILDEPTNGLDPEGIADLRALILAQTREEGTAFVISSHILGEVEQLCGRIGILDRGRMLVEGDVAELLGRTRGQRRIRVTPGCRAESILSTAPGCGFLEAVAEEGEVATMRARIADADLPRIVRLLVEAGVDVHEVASEAESLESLFRRTLTAADAGASTGEGSGADAAEAGGGKTAETGTVATGAAETGAAATANLQGGAADRPAGERRRLQAPPRSWPTRTARLVALEVLKLRRQRLARVVVAVPALVAALVPQGLWLSAGRGLQGHLALATSLELAFLPACFLLLLQAALSVAGERSDRTLRDALVAPVGRTELILARWIVLALECLLIVAVVSIAALLSTLTRFSFGDIREEAIEPLFTSSEVWEETIRAVLGVAPPLVALATLGLAVSVACGSPAMATALSLGSLMALDVAKSVFAGREGFTTCLFNSYLPTLFDRTSYLHGVTAMAGGMGDVLWIHGSPRYALQLFVPAITAAALLVLALARFWREEFRE